MNFFNQLLEQLLNESLDDIYTRYYQNSGGFHLDKDEFDNAIALDPTFNRESDRLGVYGKWLLTLASRGTLPATPREQQMLKDQLAIFDEHKRSYQPADRDVGRLKNLQQLIELNNKYNSEQASPEYIKISSHEGVEGIGESANWEVYKLLTYQGSRYVRGDNAVWCTGRADSDMHWNAYNRNSYLIVFINKHNRDDKYQAAIYKESHECREFENAQNRSDPPFLTFIRQNPDIRNILANSKYSQIITNVDEKLSKISAYLDLVDRLKAENVHDGILILDDRSLQAIQDIGRNVPTEVQIERRSFLTSIDGIEVSVDNFTSAFSSWLFDATMLRDKQLILKTEASPIDIDKLCQYMSKFNKIIIPSGINIKGKRWQIYALKNKLSWN